MVLAYWLLVSCSGHSSAVFRHHLNTKYDVYCGYTDVIDKVITVYDNDMDGDIGEDC